MPLTLDEYRADVRLMTCPECGAGPTVKCKNTDTGLPTEYVHDDRSVVFHNELEEMFS